MWVRLKLPVQVETHDGDEVRLSIPATADAVKIVRVGAAGLGTRLGFSFSEVEELRLAVGEAAALLAGPATTQILRVTYSIQADGLHIRLAVDAPEGGETGGEAVPPTARIPMLAMSVLDRVVDAWRMETSGTAINLYKVPADRARLPASHPSED
jgi:hypothetical protein